MLLTKTLVGKEGYLFLQNDTCKELEVHNNNLLLIVTDLPKKFDKYLNKYLLTIFPNKSYLYKQFLPDHFDIKYRPAFDVYKEYLKEQILDGYEYLKDEDDVYYKTDTHINLKGSYIIYKEFIKKIFELFDLFVEPLNIEITKVEVNSLNTIAGIGDLTWKQNLQDTILQDTKDTYYSSVNLTKFYMNYKIINNDFNFLILENNKLIDYTESLQNQIVDWIVISKYIIYKNNNYEKKIKVLIFYDSFIVRNLPFYYSMFNEVYLAKQIYSELLIEIIKPDYIFEFRCERFLL